MRIKNFLSVICLSVIAFGCSKVFTSSSEEEGFDHFYDQFHEDDAFQMERVKFPLEGGWEEPTGQGEWTRSNWIIHQEKFTSVSEPGYDVEIKRTENMVIEKLILRGSGYSSERRFKKIGDKWYLVFYETINL